jgi:5-(carboxyamino)imidazole ribonucleotide mutase
MSEIADPNQPEIGTAEAPSPEAEAQLEQIEQDFAQPAGPLVAIIMGSKNDMEKMEPASKYLSEQGIQSETHVMSAHRDPEKVREFCMTARARGLKVIIAGAGMSAALPGVAAAQTDLPVIGVCVAIDGAKNAGVLAKRIIDA